MKIRKNTTKFDVEIMPKIRIANILNNVCYRKGLIDEIKYLNNVSRLQSIISKAELKGRYIC